MKKEGLGFSAAFNKAVLCSVFPRAPPRSTLAREHRHTQKPGLPQCISADGEPKEEQNQSPENKNSLILRDHFLTEMRRVFGASSFACSFILGCSGLTQRDGAALRDSRWVGDGELAAEQGTRQPACLQGCVKDFTDF